MATIVLRSTKGSALTHTEMDDNFNNLNNDKFEKSGGTVSGATTFSSTVEINDAITVDTGGNTDSVIDEDGLDRSSGSAETFNIQNSGAGAMTLQVDGNEVWNSGNDGLDSGLDADLVRGLININQIEFSSVLCPHTNLVITRNSTNPAYQVDIDADALILADTSGNRYEATSVNLTVAIDQSGANGLDTGTEATSTWYHLWVIYNGTTVAGLLSTSSSSPTMPSGYTYKGYVGAIYNDSGSDFDHLEQRNHRVASKPYTDLNNGGSTSYAAVSVTVPTTATKVRFAFDNRNNTGGASTGYATVASTSSGSYGYIYAGENANTGDGNSWRGWGEILLVESQTIYYDNTSGWDLDIYTTGWEY